MEKVVYEWMHVCMHDYANEHIIHGEVKSTMLEPRVTTPIGKDYGFNCTCITGSTKFSELSTASKRYRVTEILLIQYCS